MRIAFSTENNDGLNSLMSHHFGRCPYYVLVDLQGDQVESVQGIINPYFEQHQPGMVPEFIHQQGVNVMVSGGMGRRAIEFFEQYGIDIATGAEGTVQATLQNYLQGRLQGGQPCRESVEHDH